MDPSGGFQFEIAPLPNYVLVRMSSDGRLTPMPKKEPFTISVPDATLEDLRARLARTRFPCDFGNSHWEYGTNTAYLKELVEYWHTKYDWRMHEREMNSYANYKTEIDGMPIHFIHES